MMGCDLAKEATTMTVEHALDLLRDFSAGLCSLRGEGTEDEYPQLIARLKDWEELDALGYICILDVSYDGGTAARRLHRAIAILTEEGRKFLRVAGVGVGDRPGRQVRAD
jgi:hypothetical protein